VWQDPPYQTELDPKVYIKMKTEDLLTRMDELLEMSNNVAKTKFTRRTSSITSNDFVEYGLFRGFRSAALSFLSQSFGSTHSFYVEFNEATSKKNYFHSLSAGQQILQAARNEIARGWLFEMKGLVSAEIFSDFMEMAEHLLQEGYKDAAAVMIGSVLEEHLRKLCDKNNIPIIIEKNDEIIPKKADLLNHELAKLEIYNKLEMKQIITWLDLRNKAAHGKYSEYTKEQVALLFQGVMDFMSRIPII
jgi:hypothetical protein